MKIHINLLINDHDAEEMEALEVQILASLEIANPYSINGESADYQRVSLKEV